MSTLSKCMIFLIMCVALILLGYVKGKTSCVMSNAKQEQVDRRVESKIDEKVMALTDPAVDKLLQRWTRQ